MRSVAIMGLGLMGGSLGLALKARGFTGTVAGYARRLETCEEALRKKMVDRVSNDPVEAVEGADLVVLCVPILSMPELVRHCRDRLKTSCILTDVGSTKAAVDETIRRELGDRGVQFIGSHPIAGSEQQGLNAARQDLYEKAVCILTPREDSPADQVKALKTFWKDLGSQVYQMTPQEHDRVMARTSHLPHLVAALLAATVGRENDPEKWGPFCGPGFRDTTRIAEGSPEVWRDIVATNKKDVLSELAVYKKKLEELIEFINKDNFPDLHGFLEESRSKRRALMARRGVDGNQELL
jgi:prephenate dehydrogenase